MPLLFRWLVYAAMGLVVALALLGLLEREDSASATAAVGVVRAEWPSVTRQGLMPSLTVEVENTGDLERVPSLRLDAVYLHEMQFAGATPEPESQDAVAGGFVELRYPALEPGERLVAELRFDIAQQAETMRTRGRLIVLLGGETVLSEPLSTLILP